MSELPGYRAELEQLLGFTNGRHLITITELAEFDFGKPVDKQSQYGNVRKIRRIYEIPKNVSTMPVGVIARKRVI